jgi:hypothetical protein
MIRTKVHGWQPPSMTLKRRGGPPPDVGCCGSFAPAWPPRHAGKSKTAIGKADGGSVARQLKRFLS